VKQELFKYQEEGISRLTEILRFYPYAALLADPPGAGKTAQAIKVFEFTGAKSLLVICPASLRLNWAREIKQWTGLDAQVIRTGKDIPEADIVVCSYSLASREPTLSMLCKRKWHLLILDEAHACKSVTSNTSRACLISIWAQCKYKIAITGTPVPNGRASEAWSLFSQLHPQAFGSWQNYSSRYCIPEDTPWGMTYPRSKNLEELGRIAREKFMVRRKREDILGELPALTRSIVPLDVPALKAIEASEGINIAEIVAAVEAGIPLRSDPLSTARRKLGALKAEPAAAYIRDLLDEVENVVVFCHHKEVFFHLHESLKVFSTVCINGTTSADDRQEAVDAFQRRDARVFLASLTAANTGITLTAASTVVFVEADWVPSANTQAEGRINRIGQKDIMRAIYLVVPDSLDEAVMWSVTRKQWSIDKLMQERN
jgi:SWI/SNF-related matrix-associated actin-dependent regulator 1 of chromatin subfamily A